MWSTLDRLRSFPLSEKIRSAVCLPLSLSVRPEGTMALSKTALVFIRTHLWHPYLIISHRARDLPRCRVYSRSAAQAPVAPFGLCAGHWRVVPVPARHRIAVRVEPLLLWLMLKALFASRAALLIGPLRFLGLNLTLSDIRYLGVAAKAQQIYRQHRFSQ